MKTILALLLLCFLALGVPAGARLAGASVRVGPDPSTKEITLVTNRVQL